MPSPTTVAEFVELVRKSGVIDEKRLDAHLEKLRAAAALPVEPGKLAGVLVRDGLLTRFQADQLMLGKYRRFTIGKYKVLEQLGSGGMGMVYLCEHMLMRRRVAVKVLPANKAEDAAALERFYREARAVAALDHPNIVRAYDIDHAEKLHFLVMEYVDGSSLQEIIKKAGAMDVTRACHYIRQAALGLQHAHEAANLVHRDIKPGNVLVDRNGIVKVLDMGLARFFNEDEDNITKKYDENVLGTADYLAPEQAVDSHEADIRADIYSLGATFYFCLTGRTPFQEGTVAQKLIWHQTRQPKPIRQVRPDVDEALAAVIEKMMAKRREDRYQTPLAVAEALTPWTKTPIPPPPDAEMPRLSLAATSGSTGVTTINTPTTPGSDGTLPESPKPSAVPSPTPRKAWQVTAPAPAVAPQPPTARPTPGASKASPPAAPAAAPRPPAPTVQSPAAPQPSAPTAASLLQASPTPPRASAPAPTFAEDHRRSGRRLQDHRRRPDARPLGRSHRRPGGNLARAGGAISTAEDEASRENLRGGGRPKEKGPLAAAPPHLREVAVSARGGGRLAIQGVHLRRRGTTRDPWLPDPMSWRHAGGDRAARLFQGGAALHQLCRPCRIPDHAVADFGQQRPAAAGLRGHHQVRGPAEELQHPRRAGLQLQRRREGPEKRPQGWRKRGRGTAPGRRGRDDRQREEVKPGERGV
ncbi:MAG: protein kinase [Planctomycetes bacterium]|nr:protein kinase [Planctomycetota bacterium]